MMLTCKFIVYDFEIENFWAVVKAALNWVDTGTKRLAKTNTLGRDMDAQK